jgi:hypothetical protein
VKCFRYNFVCPKPLTIGVDWCIIHYMKIILSNELTRAAFRTWDEIYPDAGHCEAAEIGELVIDRLPNTVRTEVQNLIATHGYRLVRNHIGRIIEI